MRTGVAQVPLHGGECPPWLFEKMKRLGAVMIQVIAYEYGPSEVLRRLSDPIWFQTFGCVLGFDWHSSGLTTVVCGALKEGLKHMQGELGLFFAGGKGKTSRNTPAEILEAGERYGLSNDLAGLQRISRLVAKVDSAAVQDGYTLYHHFFVFDKSGEWAVVQQGMNGEVRYARRYHWLSQALKSFVDEPHSGVAGVKSQGVLNLVSHESEPTRAASVELCHESPDRIAGILRALAGRGGVMGESGRQLSLWDLAGEDDPACEQVEGLLNGRAYPKMIMPASHPIPSPARLDSILYRIYSSPPGNYEGLLETPGVGPGTLRALAMVAEVTHGARPSFQDPVRYTFAHGGKDGYPFPVRKKDMEHSIRVLKTAVEKAKLGETEKMDAFRRLALQEKFLHRSVNAE